MGFNSAFKGLVAQGGRMSDQGLDDGARFQTRGGIFFSARIARLWISSILSLRSTILSCIIDEFAC